MLTAFYPRLHCLSVLNLIYHGNFDYPLNPWCTSFAGDSGVGKSMIADLLQLIFVGKEAYKSATHAQGARPPEGLVLNDATSGGKGLGYAFLTVEVGAGQFLVVGCYLAAAAKAVVPFIVQQGISFAYKPHRLMPLDRPLGYRDLLPASGQVLPLADMPAHMQQQQVYIKFFEHRLGDFHRLLFDNELLPLDVNQPGVLKSYANIIRSFSRSGDLDQHKNKDDLKRFLFGEEAQRSIWLDYQERVKEIEQQLADYRANDGRAKDLERKLARFHSLHTRHQAAQQAQAAWQLAQVVYWQGETRWAEATLAQATDRALATETGHWQLQHAKSQVETATAEQNYQRYLDLLATQRLLLRDTETQQQQATHARQQLDHWQPAADQARRHAQAVAEVQTWLGRYDSMATLRQAQQRHQQLRHEHALLQRLAAHLQAHGQATAFPLSGWASAASPAAAEADLATLRHEVAASQQQHVFTDLTSPDSLAGWAFRRGQPLSQAEESILTHFGRQAARCGEEIEPTYYLHDPDELFTNPIETAPGEHNPGFWLHVRGVRGWVPRLADANRAFFDADKNRLSELFAARQQASQRDLHQLTARLAREEALQAVLYQLPDWQAALAAYPRREAIERVMSEFLLPENSVFNETLAHYQADTATQARHRESSEKAKEAAEQLSDAQVNIKLLIAQQVTNDKTLAQFPESPVTLLATVEKAQAVATLAAATLTDWLRETELPTPRLPYQEAELASLSLNQLKLGEAAATQQATLATQHTAAQQANQHLLACRIKAQETVAAYVKLTGQPAPVPPSTPPPPAEEPLPTAWDEANKAYEREFDLIKDGLAPAHQERVQYDDGPALLMRELLPDLVHAVVESEEALALVAERLQSINETNRQIARLKVQLLRGVFDRVRTQYYVYVEETKKIRAYFLSKKVQITGGFKPELSYAPSADFPIDWLAVFGQVLSEQVGSELGKFAQLSSAESLEELMCQAYKSNGGPLDSPKAADLLNPRSYLDLMFNMTSARVKVNKGSTGQTFMAAALLNIARLSVIGGSEQQPGIRFMPVDEAHGLGSNYGVLLELARDKGYQVLSLSVEPMIEEASERHRTYFLAFDPDAEALLNLHPTMLNAEQKLVPVPALPVFPTSLFDDGTRQ